MSIVRIGLGEIPNYGEGYEAIFGKRKAGKKAPAAKKKVAAPRAKAKKAGKKPKKK